MSGYSSLLRNEIHKKEETIKLNLPSNFTKSFYKQFLDCGGFSQDNDFQQQLVNNPLSKDVKKFLLATSDFGKEMQGKLDLYVTSNRLNVASFRRSLNPISKNRDSIVAEQAPQKNEFFTRGDGGSNNFVPPPLSPLPSPLNFPNPRPPTPPSDLFNIPNVPRVEEFLKNNDFNFDFSDGYVLPVSDSPPIRGFAGNFLPNRPSAAKT